MFNIKRFLVSRFFAALGDQFMMFAVPLIIYKTTGSVAYSGMAFAIEWLPRLVFFPFSGTLADTINAKSLFVIVDIIRSLLVIIVGIIIMKFSSSSFVLLAIMMAFLSIGQSLVFVSMEATIPREVNVEQLPKAQSILQGIDQISQIMGPAIAAFASQYFAMDWILKIGGILFLISAINSLGIKFVNSVDKTKTNLSELGRSYTIAWSIIGQNPILLQLCGLTWIVNLVFSTALVLSPAIILKTYHLDNSYFGFLQTSAGIASLIVFFVVPVLTKKWGLETLGFFSMTLMLASGVVLWISNTVSNGFIFYLFGYISLMGMDGAFNVYIRSLRAQIIPREHLGKVTGLIILINNSSLPLVGLFIARMANVISTSDTLMCISFGSVALAATMIYFGRKKLGYQTIVPSIYS